MRLRQNGAMARRQDTSVLRACVVRLGVHRGATAAARVVQIALAERDLGHFPTAVEYADYWAVSERTAWGHRAAARAGIGDELERVSSELAALPDRSQRKLMAAPLSGRLAAA